MQMEILCQEKERQMAEQLTGHQPDKKGDKMEKIKMSDGVIAHIAKTLQLAIISGTDIVDNLRIVDLCLVDGEVNIHPEYEDIFNSNLEEMVNNANSN